MAAPYSSAITNNNKCPHGFPIGSCPICSGMGAGGGAKNRDKPRRAGEMTYNECMAAWIKIQAKKEAKIQEKINRLESLEKQAQRNKFFLNLEKNIKNFDKFFEKIENLPQVIKIPLKIAAIIIKPVLNLILKIPYAINQIQAFFSNIKSFISSTAEKMAMVLYEIKNLKDLNIFKNTKRALKILLSLFSENTENTEENEEIEKLKSKELKKIIKGFFRLRSKAQEEKQEEDVI